MAAVCTCGRSPLIWFRAKALEGRHHICSRQQTGHQCIHKETRRALACSCSRSMLFACLLLQLPKCLTVTLTMLVKDLIPKLQGLGCQAGQVGGIRFCAAPMRSAGLPPGCGRCAVPWFSHLAIMLLPCFRRCYRSAGSLWPRLGWVGARRCKRARYACWAGCRRLPLPLLLLPSIAAGQDAV